MTQKLTRPGLEPEGADVWTCRDWRAVDGAPSAVTGATGYRPTRIVDVGPTAPVANPEQMLPSEVALPRRSQVYDLDWMTDVFQ